MTLGTMIEEVYGQLGKPSYLNPYADDGVTIDVASGGAVTLIGWLNRGYRRVLNWRFPTGRIVRFRSTERTTYFAGVGSTGTATAGATNTITLDVSEPATADWYKGWAIKITGGTGSGQTRTIVGYSTGRVATVHSAWDTPPDATSTYSVTKNVYSFVDSAAASASVNIPLDPTEEIMAVLKLVDMESGDALVRADRVESFANVHDAIGNEPRMFADKDGGIVFDTPVPSDRYYRMDYFGMPPEMSSADDVPAMPPQFHEAVLLWAVWWGLRQMQEFSGAYSTKRDLEDVMSTALQQFDRGNERDDISLYMGDRYESIT